MDKKFDDTNRGVLFKNTSKTDDKHADYRGEIDVNGVAHWLNCWIRTSKQGTRYMSLSIKPKAASKAASTKTRAEEMADDIPF